MADGNLTTIGGRVSHLAALAGLTLYDLSTAAGLSRNTLPSVVQADRINSGSLRKLSIATGAKEGWITAREGAPPIRSAVKDAVARAQAERVRS